jgi:hypothetical protein
MPPPTTPTNYQALADSDDRDRNAWEDSPSLGLGLGRHDRQQHPSSGGVALPADDLEDLEGVHLATTEEKRLLWWKNAVINIAVMSCWFVSYVLLSLDVLTAIQVRIRYPPNNLQQMDVRRQIQIPALRHWTTRMGSISPRSRCTIPMASDIQAPT